MKKVSKVLLLLSVLVFAINCQQQATRSEFDVVEDNTDITTPGVEIPEEDIGSGSSGNTLKALTEEEFSIANANDFNIEISGSTSDTITSRPVNFIFGSSKINFDTLVDQSQTKMVVTARVIERSQGSLSAHLVGALNMQEDLNHNIFRIILNTQKLKEALPKVGLYVKVEVKIYIQDLREAKQYALTQRVFNFELKRVND